MTKFSMVVPFRDTPRDRKFAKESIPTMLALDPDEIVFGIDAPAAASFLDFIRGLCEDTNIRIVEVRRSDEWAMQLAHVMWTLYEACRNDVILATNIDNKLEPSVREGANLVHEFGAVTVFHKTLITGIGSRIRWWSVLRNYRKVDYVISGIYWIDRRRISTIPLEKVKKVVNGIDTMTLDHIEKSGHRIVTLEGVRGSSLDIDNPDLPWRQFGWGLWFYANRKHVRYHKKLGGLAKAFPILWCSCVALLYYRPWAIRGYLWGMAHRNHEAVSAARDTTYDMFTITGSKHVSKIRDWAKCGRLGIGFYDNMEDKGT